MSASIVIHQAHFLPWLPYVAKLSKADLFVVLDDVQFRSRYYINRTRVFNHDNMEYQWLTMPIRAARGTIARDVEIVFNNHYERLMNKIDHEYHKYDFFQCWQSYEGILRSKCTDSLLQLNVLLLENVFRELRLTMPRLEYSSRLLKGTAIQDRTDRFVRICRAVEADNLITGFGNSLIVHDIGKITEHGVRVTCLDSDEFMKHACPIGVSVIHYVLSKGVEWTRIKVDQIAGLYSKEV